MPHSETHNILNVILEAEDKTNDDLQAHYALDLDEVGAYFLNERGRLLYSAMALDSLRKRFAEDMPSEVVQYHLQRTLDVIFPPTDVADA